MTAGRRHSLVMCCCSHPRRELVAPARRRRHPRVPSRLIEPVAVDTLRSAWDSEQHHERTPHERASSKHAGCARATRIFRCARARR
eukprot:4313507-Prymnesium_polylepis.1